MPKILIVDDAAFMRLAIRTILERNGFEVVAEAENGRSGVGKYMELRPDVVTMDITMPEMTGIEALREIKAFDPKAKVIIVSALGQENYIREAVSIGAKSFIVKPFKEEHVIEAIKKIAAM